MKKLLFPLACMLMVTATSCDDTPNQPVNTHQLKGELPTCIIPEDESKPVTITGSQTYAFTMYDLNGLWTVSVANLNVPGFGTLQFTTPQMAPSGTYNRYLSFGSPLASSSGETINGFNALLCCDYYYYTGESSTSSLPMGWLCSLSFDVPGKYSVRAFPDHAYFGGSTASSFTGSDGSEQHYVSDTALFGVSLDIESRTAEIIICNAKFAEQMPAISRMKLSGLTLEGDREHGYEIKGKDITPIVGEGQGAVPYPSFVFNEIEFHPTNNLMNRAECDFEVAGRYKGKFTGSYSK